MGKDKDSPEFSIINVAYIIYRYNVSRSATTDIFLTLLCQHRQRFPVLFEMITLRGARVDWIRGRLKCSG